MIRTNKANINTVIMQNSALLTHGAIFSGDVLDTMFQIGLPAVGVSPIENFNAINRRNLLRLTAYTKLNKALAERGLSIHQTTVGGVATYHISEVSALPKDITYYRRKGKRATKRSAQLARAYSNLFIPGID